MAKSETVFEDGVSRAPILSIGLVIGVLLTLGIVALILQNTGSVTVRWLFVDGQQPLWMILAITATATVVATKLVGVVWHHRHSR